jgi:hypothetical protein
VSAEERVLARVTEEPCDLHSDARRATRQGDDPVRSSLAGKGAFATLGFGATLLALLDSPAFAQAPPDVQILQTAASLENLAVATYDSVLTLPFVGGDAAGPLMRTFVTTTRNQHAEHAKAFNDAAKKLNGAAQEKANPVLLDVVDHARATLTGPGSVIDLAITLEDTAAQTYVANTGALGDRDARNVTASIMGVEAQHVAVLLVMKALVGANLTDQIRLGPDLSRLPEAAGGAGFPEAFYKTDKSRPTDEGAVQ